MRIIRHHFGRISLVLCLLLVGTVSLLISRHAIADSVPPGHDEDHDGLHTKVELHLGLDPFDPDTDDDGLLDGEEITNVSYNGNLNNLTYTIVSNPKLVDSDGDGASDSDERDDGTDPNGHADTTDSDGDGLLDSEDAVPGDAVIDWAPVTLPHFAMIEIDLEDIDNVTVEDLTPKGALLLSRDHDTPPYSTGVYVHIDGSAHEFSQSDPQAEGVFYSPINTLIDGLVPGYKKENNVTNPYLWDPESDTYNPYQFRPGSRDERDGIVVWWGSAAPGGAFGMGWSPGGQLLPGEPSPGGNTAKIEDNGNILGRSRYWRWNDQSLSYDSPSILPTDDNTYSATVTQANPSGGPNNKWNLVTGDNGLMVSKNGGDFAKAQIDLSAHTRFGVTHQGWVADQFGDQIWANGTWYPLASLLGSTPPVEAQLHEILDTGLAVAKIRETSNAPMKLVLLVPVEVAPEVLAVNSDFDEGRIDPATGYAIPDCDDIPGVDLRTGAGNTGMKLEAEEDHLDGEFSAGELITDDMHQGWFGLSPNQLDDDFWEGAYVTIRKIDPADSETGRKETGQVRFYAKWGEGNYYGIEPYDLETLTSVNLVSGGVNGLPGQGVYGRTSTIPEEAEFWMEGVRGGKITLEWRLQKGDIDVKYTQTFLVATQQSPDKWKEDLEYKIRLDTSTDPSGEVWVRIPPNTIPPSQYHLAGSYWLRMERMSEYYDYYKECFLADEYLQWGGLARVAGSQVVSGISQTILGQPGFNPSAVGVNTPLQLGQILFSGGFDIFDSLAWQFHAFRSSSLEALEWVDENFNDDDLDRTFEAWDRLQKSIQSSNLNLAGEASYFMTDHEQNTVIVPTWRQIEVNFAASNVFTNLGTNIMSPSGDSFLQAVPGGKLADTADRWKWINDGSQGDAGSPNGIMGAWNSASHATQKSLVGTHLKDDARRFLFLRQIIVAVNDHLDQP